MKVAQFTEALLKYVPASAAPVLAEHLVRRKVWLRITAPRKSKLGDYQPPVYGGNHKISVNNNLNPFAFLLTLVHELAHLETYLVYGLAVKPHGEEWKNCFASLIKPYYDLVVFPVDVLAAMESYFKNPAASSCSDITLSRVLKRYDLSNKKMLNSPTIGTEVKTIENLAIGDQFLFQQSRLFEKQKRNRKRYFCKEISTGKLFLFHPLTEVVVVTKNQSNVSF